jgi:hypothetical protein
VPDVREASPVTVRVAVARNAWRRMINNANEVARARGSEAIGWLLGYFSPGAVTVLDSVGATRYKFQSRYGAQADPLEELQLATSYPRSVGIVGLYHSHPFRDETQHAIFHSETDDTTLKSRASRRPDYLSVVTDGHDAEVFVLDREKMEVRPEVVDGLSYHDVLRRYACDVSLRFEADLALAGMEGLVAAIEREVSQEIDRALREKDAELDKATGMLKVPGLAGKATKNAIRVVLAAGKAHVDLQIRSEIAVYLAAEDDAVSAVLRDEVLDSVVFLLWHGLDPRALTGPVVPLEANLGSLRVHETNPLPKKMYRASKRALVVKRAS